MRADVNPRVCIPHAPDPVFTVAPPGVLQLAVLRLGFATRAADQRSTGLARPVRTGFRRSTRSTDKYAKVTSGALVDIAKRKKHDTER